MNKFGGHFEEMQGGPFAAAGDLFSRRARFAAQFRFAGGGGGGSESQSTSSTSYTETAPATSESGQAASSGGAVLGQGAQGFNAGGDITVSSVDLPVVAGAENVALNSIANNTTTAANAIAGETATANNAISSALGFGAETTANALSANTRATDAALASNVQTVSQALGFGAETVHANANLAGLAIGAVSGSVNAELANNSALAESAINSVATVAAAGQQQANNTAGILANDLGTVALNAAPQSPGTVAELLNGTSPAGGGAASWTNLVLLAGGILAVVAFINSGGKRT